MPATPLSTPMTDVALASRWLADFAHAATARDEAALAALFQPDCHWRDALALTWTLDTLSGTACVVPALASAIENAAARAFRLYPGRTPPRRVRRAGVDAIEAIFSFETGQGRGSGVLRLVPATSGDDAWRAWTLFTALDELKGFEEGTGAARPRGEAYSRDFHGPNWRDQRDAESAYADRDPVVLVVGGGQAGLSIAARLRALGVDTLIVDREERIGDNWRKRYHALTLHNQVQVNHLPYMPFPPTWPAYIPKDKLAGWFEAYVESLELNFWTGTELVGGTHDEASGCWTVTLRRRDGTQREMRPRHVVMATGLSGVPNRPAIAGLETFAGTVLHSTTYDDGETWKGRRAIVIGSGNSGHDIAQDLHSSGATVTLVQRSPTLIVNIEPSAQLPYALYDEGPPLEDCDLLAASMPLEVARRTHILLTEKARQLDKPLLDGLARVGFKLGFGEDGSGWQYLYLSRGGGYYFNVGCSDLIVEGKVGLLQAADIEDFVPQGAKLRDGTTLPADLVVLATGYKGQDHLVRKLFGEAVAARVGPIWGFGPNQELRSMFVRTGQPGLWFIAGSLAQCRIYSHTLALQIKGCEAGLMPPARPQTPGA